MNNFINHHKKRSINENLKEKNFMKQEKILTERFILRTLVPNDATETYLSWLSNNDVSEYIMYKPSKLNELKKYIAQFIDDRHVYFLAIVDKKTNRHIGNIKFIFSNDSFEQMEMGILIGESDYHGKGVAGEVIQGFKNYAKDKYQAKSMTLGVHKNNIPAIKAYQKLGFIIQKNASLTADEGDNMAMIWNFS